MNLLKKFLRTAQSEIPYLKHSKEEFFFRARHLFSIPHERDFKVLKKIPIPAERVIVDVGANHGQSIESILACCPSGRIVSFEANPKLSQKLMARYRGQQQIQIRPRGLADKPGSFTLFVPTYKRFRYDALASLDRQAASSWINPEKVYCFDPKKLFIEELQCEVSTLDDENLAPFFVKIDVQGLEYSVLKGGEKTLRKYEPILLVEEFRNNPRTVALATDLGYQEYRLEGEHLVRGFSQKSPNSFLLTEKRTAELQPLGVVR